MKEKHISVGLSNEKVQFYVTDPTTDKDEEKLTDFKNKVKESLDGVLYNLPVISKKEIGTATAEEARKHHIFNSDLKAVDKTITKSTGFTAEEGLFAKTSTNFFRDSGSDIDWGGWNTTNNNINLSDITSTNSWNITIGDNNNAVLNKTEHKRYIEDGEEAEEENEYSTTITKKEIMSPIRAYNVVSDGYATVNHYYTLKTEPEELKETVETKGKAIVKYIDADDNEIKADETIKPETVIKTVKKYETKSDITVISSREEVENNDTPYDANSAKQDVIEKDGKKYKFSKVVEASDKYNNTTELTGNLKEGTTTIVYQYDYLIPVDPTKPKSPDTPDLPTPDDKIPNDPQNRSYKDLGLLKEVERNITYVYENGPKAGQEASTPVKQNARFTRTALINSRTGEVTYETDWSTAQNLPAVQSPTKDKYSVDKATVEALNVTHESENSTVVVKYSENPDVTEHDEAKDKKGKLVVKHIDAQGNLLKEEVVKENVTVATATTKVYADRDPETTYTPVDVDYSTTDKKQDVIEKDGKKYKFSKVLEVTPELNNTTEETGKLKEGTTTVVYQYDYLIPVDPSKPNDGKTTPPSPDDKIPNDPQNRSYKDLGLAKEVERNITYVYENGPKAGQEASTPVKQNARFTRTALINSRTGEVTYETEWTSSQSLPEVQSPTKDKYVVDKATVEALNVTHESENSSVVVKYSENPSVTEHDESKDKKGKVVVKHVDAQGNLLKEDVVTENVTVATATTKVYADRDPETTYTPVDVDYSTTDKKQDVIEKDGKQYKFSKVLEVTPEFNNTTEETGKVKEGTTTVVYQYDYLIPVDPTIPHDGSTTPPNPEDKIPNDPQNRSYKDLGLAKDVKRTIKYVYENGPKAGQEVDVPKIQTTRFTRTALINSRTGEVTYTNDWAKSQKLEEVTSPVKDKYVADKEKVDSLTVTNESEDVNVVVKYTENPTVIEHDEAKDKKGKVVVKHIDSKGNLLKEDVVKEDVTVATATTKVYADREPETTYTPVDVDYSTTDKKQDIIEKDGKKYKFTKVVEVTPELNNTMEETGKVKEGTTTVVYQYALLIPVDPSKPNDGQTTPPSPDDKIPNDPLNRTYKDLGLLREVTRTIKYVYKNGDKVGQKASDDVVQTVRFTRTASINSVTGEVSYDTDWNPAQSLPNVVSPTIDNYKPETGQSGAITVTHESESSIWTEYYLTTITTTVIEHDTDKDKKGTVVVKYVDINGTVLKETVVKDKVTVATARTVIETGKDPVTTYTPTNEKYSVTKDDTITVDGLTFKLNRIVPVTPELNNSVEENGLVKEGTTTVIYEYKLIIPSNDIVNNVGEYDKPVGSVPNDAPVHEIPEFTGGVNPIDPPVVEIPEYNGGVVPIDPLVVDVPEYKEPIKDEPKVEKPKEEPKVDTPKVTETPKQDTTPKKALPKTSVVSNVFAGLSSLIGLAGLSLKNKKD